MSVEAVVVGAGQAGLGVSQHLSRRGIEHVVLERGAIGDTWRTQRWDSFTLNTPNWMNRLPGETTDLQPRDAFLARDAFVARLEGYAADHRLPVRTGVEVTSVTAEGRTGLFRVSMADATGARADEPDVLTRTIVIASGGQRVPKIPAIAGTFPAHVRQLTTADYRRPDLLRSGGVLVVGSGQSGAQIAEDLLDAGRRVHLCTSAVSRFRRRYRGRDTMEWLAEAGFWDVALERLPDQKMRFATIPVTSGVGRYGHTVSLQSLAERGVTLLGRPNRVEGDRLILDDTLGANIAFADGGSADIKAGIDKGLIDRGVPLPPLEPDPADEAHPDPATVRSPAWIDLAANDIGTVIWTTGFTGSFVYLRVPVLEDGLPRQVHGVAPVSGVYFVGMPWLTRRKSGIVHGVEDDAAFVVDRLAERLAAGS